ncbi:thioredoxin-like [Brachyhypopomus gauderio]|uniref:thioredoxin-like n=1 Tax=Brachyhypopomus gauderio TaxID=698409 RepID=UPI0040426B5E
MIIIIKDKDSFQTNLKNAGDRLVVVDFTAVWCGPCRMIAPFFEELSEHPANKDVVVFLKVDVDDVTDVATECGIKSMPTFQFYKAGKKIDEFSGANKDKLKETIMRLK